MRRFMVLATLAGSAGVMWAAGPASAGPLCEGVAISGILGPHSVGPLCVPYDYQTNCRFTTAGLAPTLLVTAQTCLPVP